MQAPLAIAPRKTASVGQLSIGSSAQPYGAIGDEASIAAREVIAQRYHHSYVEPEDAQALRIWVRFDESMDVLAKWRESSDGDEATAALMLLGARASVPIEEIDWIRSAFNRAITDQTKAPLDGYDPATGCVVLWLQKAYELLSRAGYALVT